VLDLIAEEVEYARSLVTRRDQVAPGGSFEEESPEVEEALLVFTVILFEKGLDDAGGFFSIIKWHVGEYVVGDVCVNNVMRLIVSKPAQ